MALEKLKFHRLVNFRSLKFPEISKEFLSDTSLHSISKFDSANPLSVSHNTHENISTSKNKKVPSIGAAQVDYVLAISIFLVFFGLTIAYITDYFSTVRETAAIATVRSDAISLLGIADRGYEPPTWPAIVIDSFLVLLLHMDNSTLDSSSFGNNGTLNGTAACSKNIQGRVRFGCQFDAKNESLVIVNDSASLNITDEITVAAWVKIA